ncbi:hypothetical protein A2U01_0074002, partial [Trifolium medium]|nr:hypothetical protein [Trifolium medium]
MDSGRNIDQICNGCPTEDALIQRGTIDDQELDFDRLRRFVGAHGNNQVDKAPGFGRYAVEALEVRAHVRRQVAL